MMKVVAPYRCFSEGAWPGTLHRMRCSSPSTNIRFQIRSHHHHRRISTVGFLRDPIRGLAKRLREEVPMLGRSVGDASWRDTERLLFCCSLTHSEEKREEPQREERKRSQKERSDSSDLIKLIVDYGSDSLCGMVHQ